MSGKIDFKSKLYRDKEGHCIMAKMMSIQKEKITVTDMCFHAGTPHYIKQTLLNLKGEADSNTIMSGTSHPTFINVQDTQTKKKDQGGMVWCGVDQTSLAAFRAHHWKAVEIRSSHQYLEQGQLIHQDPKQISTNSKK